MVAKLYSTLSEDQLEIQIQPSVPLESESKTACIPLPQGQFFATSPREIWVTQKEIKNRTRGRFRSQLAD